MLNLFGPPIEHGGHITDHVCFFPDYDPVYISCDGHMTIFQIRLQMLMKLVGQVKYLST
jgi:hypothetical protein